MMTIERLSEFKQGQIFRQGRLPDNPKGLNMANTGKMLKFVAVKQHGDCWTVFTHYNTMSTDNILKHGDTVIREDNIRRCVPCTDEVFKNYYC